MRKKRDNCAAEGAKISGCRNVGSISVSGQLPTYPSPNSTIVNWWQVTVNVGLGEGWVGSCPDTDIDPSKQQQTS